MVIVEVGVEVEDAVEDEVVRGNLVAIESLEVNLGNLVVSDVVEAVAVDVAVAVDEEVVALRSLMPRTQTRSLA